MPVAIQSRSRKARAVLVGAIVLTASLGAIATDCCLQAWRSFGKQPSQPGASAMLDPSMSMPGSMSLPAGAAAPELDLPAVDGRERFRLSRHRGVGPVVLVFGSFTCDLLQAQIPALARIYRRHKSRVAFAFVAVREAGHAARGYEFLLEAPPAKSTQAAVDERRRSVGKAMVLAGLPLPGYLDLPDQSACEAYDAWPRRLVIVDREGRIDCDFGSSLTAPWDLEKLERLIDAQGADPDHPREGGDERSTRSRRLPTPPTTAITSRVADTSKCFGPSRISVSAYSITGGTPSRTTHGLPSARCVGSLCTGTSHMLTLFLSSAASIRRATARSRLASSER